jgi:hypothetical protein
MVTGEFHTQLRARLPMGLIRESWPCIRFSQQHEFWLDLAECLEGVIRSR